MNITTQTKRPSTVSFVHSVDFGWWGFQTGLKSEAPDPTKLVVHGTNYLTMFDRINSTTVYHRILQPVITVSKLATCDTFPRLNLINQSLTSLGRWKWEHVDGRKPSKASNSDGQGALTLRFHAMLSIQSLSQGLTGSNNG